MHINRIKYKISRNTKETYRTYIGKQKIFSDGYLNKGKNVPGAQGWLRVAEPIPQDVSVETVGSPSE